FEISVLSGANCEVSRGGIWRARSKILSKRARSSFSPAAVPVALQSLGKLRIRYRSESDDGAGRVTAAGASRSHQAATIFPLRSFFDAALLYLLQNTSTVRCDAWYGGKTKERARWQRWTRLDRRSRSFPSGWRGSTRSGQSWPTSSMSWKSPNACCHDSAKP